MGSYFYKNKKYRRLEKEKKCILQLFHFKNSQIFLYGPFQKMFNVSAEYSFNSSKRVSEFS